MNKSISRRNWIKTVGAGLSAQALPLSAIAQSEKRKPNIIYFILDELGYFDLSCMGSEHFQTPNIDRLARKGMQFMNAYAGAPTCAPTRCCLLTGKHAGHTSVRGNTGGISLKKSDVTIASVLKKAGYATGGYGKWGVGDVDTPGVPEKHGFDDFFGYYHQIHAHDFYPEYLWRNGVKVPLPGNKNGKGTQFSHHLIVDEAKKFIRQNKDNPFFCYMPWTPPHARHWPFPEDEPSWQLYKDKPWPDKIKVNAAMVSMVDRQIGEVIDLLKELNLDQDTLIVVSGDNGGEPMYNNFFNPNRHFRGTKRELYEGGLKVPMVVYWPGKIPQGVKSDFLWYFPDLMPTFAEVAGASAFMPPETDGISIVPTLMGYERQQKKHDFLYWEYTKVADWKKKTYQKNGLQQAVRLGDWKAVRMKDNVPFELYNIKDDPGETRNLASDYPGLVQKVAEIARMSHVPMPQIEPEMSPGCNFR